MKRQIRLLAVLGLAVLSTVQATAFSGIGEGGGPSTEATCSAYCAGGSILEVTCAGTCSATDVSCPSTRGWVTCNGVTTYCPSTCPTGAYCTAVNNTSCSPNGSKRSCLGDDGVSYQCTCVWGHWICPI